ncbi:MIR1 [Symbiodinium sp. CCMP2456]|nr:MIR1 [Symbiodinium sp. CCMP2456]
MACVPSLDITGSTPWVLINYDRRSIKLWAQSAPEGAAPAEARRAQFAALAAAVDLGIIGAYGSDAQGIQSLAKALRGLCRSDTSAKRQVAFALSLLPSDLQPVNVIEELVNDVTSSLDFAVGLERSGGQGHRPEWTRVMQ